MYNNICLLFCYLMQLKVHHLWKKRGYNVQHIYIYIYFVQNDNIWQQQMQEQI